MRIVGAPVKIGPILYAGTLAGKLKPQKIFFATG
jgi:hypothetical protein